MGRAAGFTLLELVVVLALLALAAGLAAPAGFRMMESRQEADLRERLLQRIGQLPMMARQQGRVLDVSTGTDDETAAAARLLDLPEGWSVQLDAPLAVRANGACSSAEGTVATPRTVFRLAIAAPFCRASLDPSS